MDIIDSPLNGLKIIKPDIFPDKRGFFFESFNEKKYKNIGIYEKFVQDNQAFSKKGSIRGLHYQVGDNEQGKLARVIYGKILDVAVDIRFDSPTFGQHYAIELTSDNNLQFWIPPGFAHGISILSDIAIFAYKCTAFYSKKDERSIIYNDSDLSIDWKVKNPIVTERDLNAINFKDIGKDFYF